MTHADRGEFPGLLSLYGEHEVRTGVSSKAVRAEAARCSPFYVKGVSLGYGGRIKI